MHGNKYVSESIDSLIQVNYERMAAFDMASKIIADEELKKYFDNKAGESERNIEELQTVFFGEGAQDSAGVGKAFLPATNTFSIAVSRKKINVIVESARCMEKHMVEWYQKIEEGLSSIPGELRNLLRHQLSEVKTGHSYLLQLTTPNK